MTAGTTETATPPVRKSLDEIAAMMAENTMKMRDMKPQKPEPKPLPNKVAKQAEPEDEAADLDTTDEADEEQRLANIGRGDDDHADGVPVDPDASADAGDSADPDADAGEDDEFEIDDDTVFQLDEDTAVSFKDLKSKYTADKDILELRETQRTATEEALVTRQKALEDSEKAKQAAMAVFQHFEKLISTPMFSKPDASLKNTDPAKYIKQLEYYEQDQERIREQQSDLTAAFDNHMQTEKELKTSLKRQTIEKLGEVLPALRSSDEKVRARASQDILDAATHYGFKPEEVNEALDYRLYQMAHDAQQYRKIMAKSKNSVTETKEEKEVKVRNQTRTLRPRGVQAQSRLTAKAKLVKVAKAKAAKSGKIDDVADFIAAQRRG